MRRFLHGWDDEKIYFYDEERKEFSVNDYPELFEDIVKMCADYFKQKESREEVG